MVGANFASLAEIVLVAVAFAGASLVVRVFFEAVFSEVDFSEAVFVGAGLTAGDFSETVFFNLAPFSIASKAFKVLSSAIAHLNTSFILRPPPIKHPDYASSNCTMRTP
ncbi:MAG: hypothetical protein LBH87_00730 [Coriobacteriales bacterium]|nr:hypothetical protein [Coriobacteriales bacterium]